MTTREQRILDQAIVGLRAAVAGVTVSFSPTGQLPDDVVYAVKTTIGLPDGNQLDTNSVGDFSGLEHLATNCADEHHAREQAELVRDSAEAAIEAALPAAIASLVKGLAVPAEHGDRQLSWHPSRDEGDGV